MPPLSPHTCLYRASRLLQVVFPKSPVQTEQALTTNQLAPACRALSSLSRRGDAVDTQPAISELNKSGERLAPFHDPRNFVVTNGYSPIQPQPAIEGERLDDVNHNARLPRSVQAIYLRPLRRKAEYGLPVCDLQLRSYSVRNLEFFADFALRAAYYLNLPVSGPVPLPKIVERWTVPRSNFVHKKSQENFERITLRRLIQIKDGSPQTVQAWLAFLRKHAFYGVGLKANIWEYESIDVAKNMDQALPEVETNLEPYLSRFGRQESQASGTHGSLSEFLGNERLSLNKGPLVNVRSGWKSSQDLLSHKTTIFSGIQPTAVPHLGNYLGALREWSRLQNRGTLDTKLIFSIVDLHALTVPQEGRQLRNWRKEAFATLLAVGLDPTRSTIFYQSSVPQHAELFWILSTVASTGYLSRMTQWKSKLQLPEDASLDSSEVRSKLRLGLFSYPVLQAADILVHRATHVPVGDDQRQHLEFARHIANSFNRIYGPIFPSPEAVISPAKRVMSLKEPTLKMSKSHPDERSRINLTDSLEDVRIKVKAALTDSEPGISYDPIRRPGVSNLIEIISHLEGRTCHEIALSYESTSLRVLKDDVANKICRVLAPIREKYYSLMSDGDHLDTVAEKGARDARANAETTMKKVREVMGL
ncbi:30S ribosomal protein S10, mitochondrial precursor [Aspergillus lucknowensis]|uniref:tryptophan--tRNA ligase n=1 Tax=Aspergillus lucknowensis TaxID=176173 RepID=A0ABR4LES9_9EURO